MKLDINNPDYKLMLKAIREIFYKKKIELQNPELYNSVEELKAKECLFERNFKKDLFYTCIYDEKIRILVEQYKKEKNNKNGTEKRK